MVAIVDVIGCYGDDSYDEKVFKLNNRMGNPV
jgi:hypothetical protein